MKFARPPQCRRQKLHVVFQVDFSLKHATFFVRPIPVKILFPPFPFSQPTDVPTCCDNETTTSFNQSPSLFKCCSPLLWVKSIQDIVHKDGAVLIPSTMNTMGRVMPFCPNVQRISHVSNVGALSAAEVKNVHGLHPLEVKGLQKRSARLLTGNGGVLCFNECVHDSPPPRKRFTML